MRDIFYLLSVILDLRRRQSRRRKSKNNNRLFH